MCEPIKAEGFKYNIWGLVFKKKYYNMNRNNKKFIKIFEIVYKDLSDEEKCLTSLSLLRLLVALWISCYSCSSLITAIL